MNQILTSQYINSIYHIQFLINNLSFSSFLLLCYSQFINLINNFHVVNLLNNYPYNSQKRIHLHHMQQHSKSQSKTLWLGDLQIYMDEPYLNTMISSLGYAPYLISIKVIKEKQTGISAKYGFLQFNSHQIAQKFIQQFNGKMIPNTPNKYFKLKWASYGGGVKPGNMNLTSTPGEISIYIGDLDPSVTQAKLYQFFKAKYNSVFAAKIISDNTTKASKGYGFVKFTNSDQAQRAIAENNGTNLQGKAIKVSHAYMKTKEENRQEEQDNNTQGGQMIRVYQQFYSMMNDPILRANNQKHLQKGVTGESIGKKTFKQRLEGLKSLPHVQTKLSEDFIQSLPRVVCFNSRRQIESRIFMS